ncbi:MAG TPA: hypothetical protein VH592_11245 [Gemmataceae bacterium]
MLQRKSVRARGTRDEARSDREDQGEENPEQQSLEDALGDARTPDIFDIAPTKYCHEVGRAYGPVDGIGSTTEQATGQNSANSKRSYHQRMRSPADLRQSCHYTHLLPPSDCPEDSHTPIVIGRETSVKQETPLDDLLLSYYI